MKNPFSPNPKNINLCLSGGGALGFAHIGVIQALEENGIFATRISGASMGAVIGAFYAAGYSPAQMLDLIKKHKLYKISKLLTFYSRNQEIKGLSSHQTLREVIQKEIPHNSFDGLQKKFFIGVSDLCKATYRIVSEGNELDKWVAASASIPGVFEAIRVNDTIYTDGGVLNNMPAQPFESDFKRTIGVDVINYLQLESLSVDGIRETMLTSMRAAQHQNSEEGRDICYYLIEPKIIPAHHEFSFEEYYEIYLIGYETAKEYIAKNKGILKLKMESHLSPTLSKVEGAKKTEVIKKKQE